MKIILRKDLKTLKGSFFECNKKTHPGRIYPFPALKVVCDETNNLPEDVANNKLTVDISIDSGQWPNLHIEEVKDE